eukprot:c9628_g1_i1.p1 GENE.c9628_g1_i1~~c9628_g1_i1.p1  ORF type:complete len:506 (+),score=100.64 c9628_g1_i1:40-1557(+)
MGTPWDKDTLRNLFRSVRKQREAAAAEPAPQTSSISQDGVVDSGINDRNEGGRDQVDEWGRNRDRNERNRDRDERDAVWRRNKEDWKTNRDKDDHWSRSRKGAGAGSRGDGVGEDRDNSQQERFSSSDQPFQQPSSYASSQQTFYPDSSRRQHHSPNHHHQHHRYTSNDRSLNESYHPYQHPSSPAPSPFASPPSRQHANHNESSAIEFPFIKIRPNETWIVFDMNGTLTSPSNIRRSGFLGTRPGIHHVSRLNPAVSPSLSASSPPSSSPVPPLSPSIPFPTPPSPFTPPAPPPTTEQQPVFRLCLWSSAQRHNVFKGVDAISDATNNKLKFDLVLSREHTMPATSLEDRHHLPHHQDNHQRGDHRQKAAFSTVKPLSRFFSDLSRVVLVDDTDKASQGEEPNLIAVPSWSGNYRAQDQVLEVLVNEILARLSPSTDVRNHTAAISEILFQLTPASKDNDNKRFDSSESVSTPNSHNDNDNNDGVLMFHQQPTTSTSDLDGDDE